MSPDGDTPLPLRGISPQKGRIEENERADYSDPDIYRDGNTL